MSTREKWENLIFNRGAPKQYLGLSLLGWGEYGLGTGPWACKACIISCTSSCFRPLSSQLGPSPICEFSLPPRGWILSHISPSRIHGNRVQSISLLSLRTTTRALRVLQSNTFTLFMMHVLIRKSHTPFVMQASALDLYPQHYCQ